MKEVFYFFFFLRIILLRLITRGLSLLDAP